MVPKSEQNYLMKDSTTKSNILKYSFFLSSIFLLFVIVAILSAVKNDPDFYPSWFQIGQEIINIFTKRTIFVHFSTTIVRIILVMLSSLIITTLIALLYVLMKESIYLLKPWITIMKSAPLAIIALYILITLGDEKAPYFITLLVTLPVTIEGFTTAIDNINPNIIMELRVTTARSSIKFFKVYLPMILPYIGMCLLQTFGLGLKVMVMSEYLCATKVGIGRFIQTSKINFEYDKLFATLIIVVFIVIAIEILIRFISKKFNYSCSQYQK